MKALLSKLGLNVNQDSAEVPSLSRLHLCAARPAEIAELVHSWHEAGIVTKHEDGNADGVECIKGENDLFLLEQEARDGAWDMDAVKDAVPSASAASSVSQSPPTSERKPQQVRAQPQADEPSTDSHTVDYNALPKYLILHETSLPTLKSTPQFNTHAFFSNLKQYQQRSQQQDLTYGNLLLYGEVVTSTSTLLEKNPTFLSTLPTGLTATATTQVAGRGRGTNVWVSPPGSLMFSTVMRHSLALSSSAPVVFVQYLAALAVVKGIHSYEKGCEKIPVRLKWPNDVYAEAEKGKFVKIGGILVNSSYSGGDYTLVVGIGLNVANTTSPTTCLNALAQKQKLPPFALEKLLPSFLVQFEVLYTRFCRTGFDKSFQDLYYGCWLHTDQIVTLETEGGARARIKGITTDWGLLVAEEVTWEGRSTGRRFQLQSDSNSFDFFKGLLKRKA